MRKSLCIVVVVKNTFFLLKFYVLNAMKPIVIVAQYINHLTYSAFICLSPNCSFTLVDQEPFFRKQMYASIQGF